jgi:hypothetical protein
MEGEEYAVQVTRFFQIINDKARILIESFPCDPASRWSSSGSSRGKDPHEFYASKIITHPLETTDVSALGFKKVSGRRTVILPVLNRSRPRTEGAGLV